MTQQELEQNHKLTLELFDAFKKICDDNDVKYYVAEGTAIGTVREKGFIPWDTNMDINLIIDQFNKLDKVMEDNVPEEMEWKRAEARMIKRLTHKDKSKSSDLNPCPNLDISILAPTSNNLFVRYLHLLIIHYGYEAFRLKKTLTKRKFPYNLLKIIASLVPTSWYFIAQRHFFYRYNLKKSKYLINMAPGGRLHKGDIINKEWIEGPKEIFGEFEGRTVRLPSNYDAYLTCYYGDYMTPKKGVKGKKRYAK